jgi:hypothetical protein
MAMNTTPQILPAFTLGADAGPGRLTVSGVEAWSSLMVIAGAALVVVAGSGWAVWFAAASA